MDTLQSWNKVLRPRKIAPSMKSLILSLVFHLFPPSGAEWRTRHFIYGLLLQVSLMPMPLGGRSLWPRVSVIGLGHANNSTERCDHSKNTTTSVKKKERKKERKPVLTHCLTTNKYIYIYIYVYIYIYILFFFFFFFFIWGLGLFLIFLFF